MRGRDTPIWRAILGYSWYTFRMALVGLLLGGIFGVALAVVMARFKVIERGLLPYVIASQTVPLIALAPQVGCVRRQLGPAEVDVGVVARRLPRLLPDRRRHPQGPEFGAGRLARADGQLRRELVEHAREAASSPPPIPSMVPGLKLAATASVIGVIVSEISTGVRGVGFASLTYGQKATSDPAQVYTAVFGAASLGLVMFGFIVGIEAIAMRNRPREVA